MGPGYLSPACFLMTSAMRSFSSVCLGTATVVFTRLNLSWFAVEPLRIWTNPARG